MLVVLAAGITVPDAGTHVPSLAEGDLKPEDFWCPEVAPVPGGLDEDPLPRMKPPADHDGTVCLKWDETLWSHADHFRVFFCTLVFVVYACCCASVCSRRQNLPSTTRKTYSIFTLLDQMRSTISFTRGMRSLHEDYGMGRLPDVQGAFE